MKWQTRFPERILLRGYHYYLSDSVKDLKIYNNRIESYVEGSEEYKVEIDINDDKIVSMECSCPYAQDGHLCKHMAATLFEYTQDECIIDEDEYYDDYEDRDYYDDEEDEYSTYQKEDDTVLKLLEEETNIEKLRFLALKVLKSDASYNFMYKDVLQAPLIEMSQTVYVDEAIKLIRDSNEEKELNQYISNMISLYIEHNEVEQGMVFLQWLINEMASYTNCSFNVILNEAKKLLEKLNVNQKERMLIFLLDQVESRNEIMDMIVENYNELTYVTIFVNEMNHWINNLNYSFNTSTKQRREDFIKSFLKLAYEKGLNEKILDSMIQDHQNLDCIKQWKIQRCIDNKDFTKARELLEKSYLNCQDKRTKKNYLVQYKELLINQKDSEKLKDVLRELLRIDHDIKTYRELKKLYTREDFKEVRFELFSEYNYDPFLLELYVEEKNWYSLFKNLSMQSNINLLQRYEKSIPKELEPNIVQIYQEILEKKAQFSANRNVYREWAKTMIHMLKFQSGNQVVKEMLEHWRLIYSTRRAMQEELEIVYDALRKVSK